LSLIRLKFCENIFLVVVVDGDQIGD